MVLKDVRSPERLVDEAALFLHRRDRPSCPRRSGRCSTSCTDAGAVLAGKKVLIVDDDIRNIFAMTSLLEPYEMNIAVGRDRARRDRDAPAERRTSTSS